MKTYVLKGSKQEISEGLARIDGEVREAIVFVEETPALAPASANAEDIFAEMQPYIAQGKGDLDDSREAIYTRLERE